MASGSNGGSSTRGTKAKLTVASLLHANAKALNDIAVRVGSDEGQLISCPLDGTTTSATQHYLPTVANSRLLYKSVSPPMEATPITNVQSLANSVSLRDAPLHPHEFGGKFMNVSPGFGVKSANKISDMVTSVKYFDDGPSLFSQACIGVSKKAHSQSTLTSSNPSVIVTESIPPSLPLYMQPNGSALITCGCVLQETLTLTNASSTLKIDSSRNCAAGPCGRGRRAASVVRDCGGLNLTLPPVLVPRGWNRILEKGQITYISPNKSRLRSLPDTIHYLTIEGTCKCGLECPLVPAEVFNFNPTVPSKFGSSTDASISSSASNHNCVVYHEFSKSRLKLLADSNGVSTVSPAAKRGKRSSQTTNHQFGAVDKSSPERKKIHISGVSPLEMFQSGMEAINCLSSHSFGKSSHSSSTGRKSPQSITVNFRNSDTSSRTSGETVAPRGRLSASVQDSLSAHAISCSSRSGSGDKADFSPTAGPSETLNQPLHSDRTNAGSKCASLPGTEAAAVSCNQVSYANCGAISQDLTSRGSVTMPFPASLSGHGPKCAKRNPGKTKAPSDTSPSAPSSVKRSRPSKGRSQNKPPVDKEVGDGSLDSLPPSKSHLEDGILSLWTVPVAHSQQAPAAASSIAGSMELKDLYKTLQVAALSQQLQASSAVYGQADAASPSHYMQGQGPPNVTVSPTNQLPLSLLNQLQTGKHPRLNQSAACSAPPCLLSASSGATLLLATSRYASELKDSTLRDVSASEGMDSHLVLSSAAARCSPSAAVYAASTKDNQLLSSYRTSASQISVFPTTMHVSVASVSPQSAPTANHSQLLSVNAPKQNLNLSPPYVTAPRQDVTQPQMVLVQFVSQAASPSAATVTHLGSPLVRTFPVAAESPAYLQAAGAVSTAATFLVMNGGNASQALQKLALQNNLQNTGKELRSQSMSAPAARMHTLAQSVPVQYVTTISPRATYLRKQKLTINAPAEVSYPVVHYLQPNLATVSYVYPANNAVAVNAAPSVAGNFVRIAPAATPLHSSAVVIDHQQEKEKQEKMLLQSMQQQLFGKIIESNYPSRSSPASETSWAGDVVSVVFVPKVSSNLPPATGGATQPTTECVSDSAGPVLSYAVASSAGSSLKPISSSSSVFSLLHGVCATSSKVTAKTFASSVLLESPRCSSQASATGDPIVTSPTVIPLRASLSQLTGDQTTISHSELCASSSSLSNAVLGTSMLLTSASSKVPVATQSVSPGPSPSAILAKLLQADALKKCSVPFVSTPNLQVVTSSEHVKSSTDRSCLTTPIASAKELEPTRACFLTSTTDVMSVSCNIADSGIMEPTAGAKDGALPGQPVAATTVMSTFLLPSMALSPSVSDNSKALSSIARNTSERLNLTPYPRAKDGAALLDVKEPSAFAPRSSSDPRGSPNGKGAGVSKYSNVLVATTCGQELTRSMAISKSASANVLYTSRPSSLTAPDMDASQGKDQSVTAASLVRMVASMQPTKPTPPAPSTRSGCSPQTAFTAASSQVESSCDSSASDATRRTVVCSTSLCDASQPLEANPSNASAEACLELAALPDRPDGLQVTNSLPLLSPPTPVRASAPKSTSEVVPLPKSLMPTTAGFLVDDLVWVQLSGWPPWPGKIVSCDLIKKPVPSSGKVWVSLFGSGQVSQVLSSQLKSLDEGLEGLDLDLKKRRYRANKRQLSSLEAAIALALEESERQVQARRILGADADASPSGSQS